MEILLIRHAIAAAAGPGQDDSERELTSKGITRFRKVVGGMQRLHMVADRVLYSPWLRAAQTAELLEPIVRGPSRATELLAGEPGDELIALLGDQPKSGSLALVGHQPWLAETLSILCFGSPRQGENIRFKKGGVAHLEGEPMRAGMDLVGFYTPRSLRHLR